MSSSNHPTNFSNPLPEFEFDNPYNTDDMDFSILDNFDTRPGHPYFEFPDNPTAQEKCKKLRTMDVGGHIHIDWDLLNELHEGDRCQEIIGFNTPWRRARAYVRRLGSVGWSVVKKPYDLIYHFPLVTFISPQNQSSSTSMEALVCRQLGDPTTPPDSSETTALTVSTSHPIPTLISPTSIRVRIKSTSLNYANYLQILGKYQEKFALPFVPGSDYSGVVDSVGAKVTKFKVGDRVCSFAGVGSFAQFIVADEKDLYEVPEGCDLVAAGALPVAYGTSHVALVHRANLKSGQVLLVLGAAGGVGLAAVQIGKACGAIVVAVARGTEKVEFLKSMGVDHVVDLSKGGVIASVKEFLKTKKLKGVDVLYDPVGGKLTKESMKLLNWGAQILVIGFASGEVPLIPANIALVKNWTIHGLYWGSYKVHYPSVLEDSLKELLSWLASGKITIYISHSYKLQEANLAFLDIRDRKVIGKVMITFDDPKTITSSKL
ncbi:hypothetical protein QVD17_31197 [Tagetes erecta]|uniref:Enoyl reductase (ER) domain-containing protein n=1 Tax=Tagetes erecta TaxID=13708 RepID=A0AAD8K5S7_TARER|nr:hypothetical protein QVD17_31197 [Tagetes erecta]